jgi:hypothetical protein
MKIALLTLMIAVALPALSQGAGPAIVSLDTASKSLIGTHFVNDLSASGAKKSVRGTKALWTALSVQKPAANPEFDSLESDLKNTDLEGQLRDAGFRIMDPKKRSLAIGLRPTLVLTLRFIPKGALGNDTDFYLVMAEATQDVTPLGGDKISMTTWLKVGEPIPSSGHSRDDIDAIRASAKACVRAFIDTAQDNDAGTPAPSKP